MMVYIVILEHDIYELDDCLGMYIYQTCIHISCQITPTFIKLRISSHHVIKSWFALSSVVSARVPKSK